VSERGTQTLRPSRRERIGYAYEIVGVAVRPQTAIEEEAAIKCLRMSPLWRLPSFITMSGATAHCVHRRQNKKPPHGGFFQNCHQKLSDDPERRADTLEDFRYERRPNSKEAQNHHCPCSRLRNRRDIVSSNEFWDEETLNPVIWSALPVKVK